MITDELSEQDRAHIVRFLQRSIEEARLIQPIYMELHFEEWLKREMEITQVEHLLFSLQFS